ncbi:MAG: cell division protein FtsX [Rhodobacteraceae bacterium]|nr:cell division protein FtsX [Paracoccaceae bacterium]
MVRVFLFLFGSRSSDQIVPPRGNSAWLTVLASISMAFIAVFALALTLAVDRVANRWSLDLAQTATVRIIAPNDEIDNQTEAALNALRTTPGIASAEVLDAESQAELLAPWLGKDLPIENLPLPRLIEVTVIGNGPDINNLTLRLSAEAPGARFDDHRKWRQPLRDAANQLRLMALASLALVGFTLAIIVTLAANASLASNAGIIHTLRLIGATDAYIARAFVRRITFRTAAGALLGTVLAMLALFPFSDLKTGSTYLTGMSFEGWHWALPLGIPALAALTALIATRTAASRHLHRAA